MLSQNHYVKRSLRDQPSRRWQPIVRGRASHRAVGSMCCTRMLVDWHRIDCKRFKRGASDMRQILSYSLKRGGPTRTNGHTQNGIWFTVVARIAVMAFWSWCDSMSAPPNSLGLLNIYQADWFMCVFPLNRDPLIWYVAISLLMIVVCKHVPTDKRSGTHLISAWGPSPIAMPCFWQGISIVQFLKIDIMLERRTSPGGITKWLAICTRIRPNCMTYFTGMISPFWIAGMQRIPQHITTIFRPPVLIF